ncbi:TetR/AcrR family transcriptional regulator [Phytomonospora endophytica]|uniref:TetR/AcrR family transcriptional repressor of lmrAB and yxaGH operons n=1 Tax=Phytomonospora endophytica TaxID=714109 RepID=A0A841FNP1_9ACTN|nr:TetR/AcrR family transcriptional regulator [Phytomonospora endophytica]MBB6034209.1 TetR/AcrR family transcriptional repressor of lmrAB and yxaGH operons [Phytomonospora endophytica]GIG66601.1 TetR family transcriptional regulator [Phytomonospora endophytica]
MATKGDETRARLITATRALIEAKGYHGTGLNEVIATSGAPRGSIYHHFPGGKDQLVTEALAAAGREVDGMVAEAAATTRDSRDLVMGLLGALTDRMVAADYAKGCPVATVALEVAASNDALAAVCDGIYTSWRRALAGALLADGHPTADVDDLAATVLALIEGALLLARTARSRTPVDQAGRHIARLLTTG